MIAISPRQLEVFVAIALSGMAALGAEVVWTRLVGMMLGALIIGTITDVIGTRDALVRYSLRGQPHLRFTHIHTDHTTTADARRNAHSHASRPAADVEDLHARPQVRDEECAVRFQRASRDECEGSCVVAEGVAFHGCVGGEEVNRRIGEG